MKTNNNNLRRLAAAMPIAALLLASCQDDELTDRRSYSGPEVRFTVAENATTDAATRAAANTGTVKVVRMHSDNPEAQPLYLHIKEQPIPSTTAAKHATRATQVTQNSFHKQFGVYGYMYTEDDMPTSAVPDYMSNLKVSEQGGVWTPDDDSYRLPGKGWNVKFFGYAPYNASGLTVPTATAQGEPLFSYTVPEMATDQQDVCVTTGGTVVDGGKQDAEVKLNFSHILSSVKFIEGTIPKGTRRGLRMAGLKYKGAYNAATGQWALDDDVTTHRASQYGALITEGNSPAPGANLLQYNQDESQAKADPEQVFMVMPQQFGDDARIEFDYVPEGGDYMSDNTTYTINLKELGTGWEAGTNYTYTISLNIEEESQFIVTPVSTSGMTGIDYMGAGISFNVTAKKGEGPLDYVVEFSPDGKTWSQVWSFTGGTGAMAKNPPLMIKHTNRTGISTTNYTWTQNVNIAQAPAVLENDTQQNMIARGEKGSTSQPHDIAGGNSSNCYIVNSPGYYQLPCVPGNTLKNDAANGSVMGRFKNYKGSDITSGNMWLDVKSVELLWQDANGVVTNVRPYKMGTRTYIQFDVLKENISECNAVLGALDDQGNVMWSWHIWIVDLDPNSSVVSVGDFSGGSRNFLTVPLGFVEGGYKTYKGRSETLRFRRSDATADNAVEGVSMYSFPLQQASSSRFQTNGRYVVYQWGRKDPLCPIEKKSASSIGFATLFTNGYDIIADEANQKLGSSDPIQEWIKHPTKFGTNNTDASITKATLWNLISNANATTDKSTSVTKTPYDPSPKGYKIPPRPAFEGLINSGNNPAVNKNAGRALGYQATVMLFGSINGTTVPTYSNSGKTMMIELLGVMFKDASVAGVSFSPVSSYYGNSGAYWTAGKYAAGEANMFSLLNVNSMWGASFDVWGESTATGLNKQYRNICNAFGVIPVKE